MMSIIIFCWSFGPQKYLFKVYLLPTQVWNGNLVYFSFYWFYGIFCFIISKVWTQSFLSDFKITYCSTVFKKHVIVFQSLSHIWLSNRWTVAHQTLLTSTVFQSLLRFMFIESMMLSNHFILCCLFLLLPSIFSSIKIFSKEMSLCIRWPKY